MLWLYQRRSGNVSHFLLAVADESSKDENDMPTEFYTFTKVRLLLPMHVWGLAFTH